MKKPLIELQREQRKAWLELREKFIKLLRLEEIVSWIGRRL